MQVTEPLSSTSNSSFDTSNAAMASKAKQNGVTTNGVHTTSETKPNESPDSSETESLDKLGQVSVILLRQAIVLLDENLSDDAQLTYESKFIPGSTIGKHLRHATDHFSLLLDSLSRSDSSSLNADSARSIQRELELNYDVRARGTPMESSRAAARGVVEDLILLLQRSVPGVERDRSVKLTAVTPFVQTFKTSFGRELWFAALHAIHHWSLIRVIAGELDIQLEDSFGVAPSTLVYRGYDGPLGKAKI